jgi:hypothetical protein
LLSSIEGGNLGKGRKKAIKKFTTRDELRLLAIIAVGMAGMIVLWMLGIFRLDAD